MADHLRELVDRRQVRIHIADEAQAHDVVDVVQRVADQCGERRVASPGRAPLARVRIHEVRAGGAGTEQHPAVNRRIPAVAPPQRELARAGGHGPGNDRPRDAHPRAVYLRAGIGQQGPRLDVVDDDAGAFQAWRVAW